MKIAVIDYGMGNLRSVAKALERVAPEAEVLVTGNPEDLHQAHRVVFPGQGAMPDCMRELNQRGLREAVAEAAANRPFLGICLGLQMLFQHSEEGPSEGLGLLAGSVRRFGHHLQDEQGQKLKVPHMGWNQVLPTRSHALWEGIAEASRFYFVHSYFVEAAEASWVAAETSYPNAFTSAVARDNLFAVQFHPEKSAGAGLALLANFVKWNP
jgi:glutamine amidotransferase